jgi:hypothetical protein
LSFFFPYCRSISLSPYICEKWPNKRHNDKFKNFKKKKVQFLEETNMFNRQRRNPAHFPNWAGRVSQVVECLPSRGQTPIPPKKKKEEEEKREEFPK